tara:strand:- start:317 stop:481 length:165 start_codon:yes stop_codon:yes gene_type:complete
MKTKVNNQDRGLIAGYRPNRLSFYIILILSNRIEELHETIVKDMQKYKIVEEEE